jgi:hypothetical protein
MKGKLIFNLPENQSEFDMATDAQKMHAILFDLKHKFFRDLEEKKELNQKTVQFLRREVIDLIDSYQIRNLE